MKPGRKKEAAIAGADEVLETLTSTLRREMNETVIVNNKTRETVYDEQDRKIVTESVSPVVMSVPPKLSDVIRAAELLGKKHKLFKDSVDVGIEMPNIISDVPALPAGKGCAMEAGDEAAAPAEAGGEKADG